MLDWLKNINKESPEFWKKYLSKFGTKSKRYVVLSAEATGINPHLDVITSIGAVAVEKDAVMIGDSFEITLLQYKYLHDNGLSNEFIVDSTLPKLNEPDAIEAFVEFIGNSILVGHRIHLEVDLINEALEKMHCGRLKNEALDIEIMYQKWQDISEKPFSLDELCANLKIEKPERHTSSEDAYKIALIFLKLKSRLRFALK